MVKEGFYFSIPLLLIGGMLLFLGWNVAGLILIGLGCFVLFFFRNPDRKIPTDPGLIVCPADGKVVEIEKQENGRKVSIFLSIFNVHVVRSPIDGRIAVSEYRKGRFLLAFDRRASLENEQQFFSVDGEHVVQFALIAGLVARRIVCWKQQGDQLARGDRMALIRFGSRVDILIPPEYDLKVNKGDRVRAGCSIIAQLKETL